MAALAGRPRIVGLEYSVYAPEQVQRGLRLWTEAFLRALPQQVALPPPEAAENENDESDRD